MSVDDKKKCEDFQELLDAYFDKELGGQEAELVEEHLSQCQSCLEKLSDLKSLLGHLKSLPEPVCPRDFSELVEQRILSQTAREAPLKDTKIRHLHASTWLWAAAGVLLIGLSLSFFLRPAGELAQVPANRQIAPEQSDPGKWQIASLPPESGKSPIPTAKVGQGRSPAGNSSPKLAQRAGAARTKSAPAVAGVVAFYDDELDEDGSNLGISTNEDGLYAIKL